MAKFKPKFPGDTPFAASVRAGIDAMGGKHGLSGRRTRRAAAKQKPTTKDAIHPMLAKYLEGLDDGFGAEHLKAYEYIKAALTAADARRGRLYFVSATDLDGENKDLFVNADSPGEAERIMRSYYGGLEPRKNFIELRAIECPVHIAARGAIKWGDVTQNIYR